MRRKTEIHEIEERKNTQISTLMRNHEKAFSDIKNYYNDITLNNLALINTLKVSLWLQGPRQFFSLQSVTVWLSIRLDRNRRCQKAAWTIGKANGRSASGKPTSYRTATKGTRSSVRFAASVVILWKRQSSLSRRFCSVASPPTSNNSLRFQVNKSTSKRTRRNPREPQVGTWGPFAEIRIGKFWALFRIKWMLPNQLSPLD